MAFREGGGCRAWLKARGVEEGWVCLGLGRCVCEREKGGRNLGVRSPCLLSKPVWAASRWKSLWKHNVGRTEEEGGAPWKCRRRVRAVGKEAGSRELYLCLTQNESLGSSLGLWRPSKDPQDSSRSF